MNFDDKFCLKWNDFHQNIGTSFHNLREDEDLSDVTLISDNRKQIQAHKIVLSSSSAFFKDLFSTNKKHIHPLIYMKGIKTNDLTSILDFIYYGEVNIPQEGLNDFLGIANELELKGLSQSNLEGSQENYQTETHSEFDVDAGSKVSLENVSVQTSDWTNSLIPKNELDILDEAKEDVIVSVGNDPVMVTNDDVVETVKSMIEKTEGIWRCTMCGKTIKDLTNMKRHVESQHTVGSSHTCNTCGKEFRSSGSLNFHNYTKHKNPAH